MKTIATLLVSLFVFHAGRSVADEYVPADWNRAARQAFAESRFGIFVHWGIYANYAQGEWYQQKANLDAETYGRMKDGFFPSKFDAREWAKVFRDAGARYVTITSRHHDGFSLWPTKADDGFNIAETPFKRDILGELATACREEGLQLNFYYSLMDWHRKDYPSGSRSWRVLNGQKGDYESYRAFMLAQLGELIDAYAPGMIWFDGEWDNGRLDWKFDELYDFIHVRKTLVANNNHRPIRSKEDVQLFERDLPGDTANAMFSKDQPVANDRPIEQCDVIQKNVWGYRIEERNFRSARDVVELVVRAAARNSNLLLNVGPDGSGRLPARAVEVLAKVGEWFRANGESIYGTVAGGIASGRAVVSTRKGSVLYLHFLDPAVSSVSFTTDGAVASAVPLAGEGSATATVGADGVTTVSIVRPTANAFDFVIKCVVE